MCKNPGQHRARGQAEGAYYSGTRGAASDCGQAERAMATYTTSQNPAGAPAAGPAADACAFDASADYSQSFHLRVAAFFIICACSSAGVLVPLLTRLRPQMNGTQRGGWLFIAKAFGAGVILAVGLIHVFPDASTTLSDPCLGAGTLVFFVRARCCRLLRRALAGLCSVPGWQHLCCCRHSRLGKPLSHSRHGPQRNAPWLRRLGQLPLGGHDSDAGGYRRAHPRGPHHIDV